MKYKECLLAVAVSSIVPFTFADYTVDIGVSYRSTEIDQTVGSVAFDPMGLPFASFNVEANSDEKTNTKNLTVYFGRVRTSGVPLKEAGFLSKLGSFTIEANVSNSELDFVASGTGSVTTAASVDSDAVSLELSTRFVTPGFPIILGLGTRFDFIEVESSTSIEDESEAITVSAELGVYITGNGAITLGYQHSTLDVDSEPDDQTAKVTSLSYKHIFQLGGNHSIGLDLSASKSKQEDSDSRSRLKLGVTYYPTNRFSVSAQWVSQELAGDLDAKGYVLNTDFFFNEYISASLALGKFTASETERSNISIFSVVDEKKYSDDSVFFKLNFRF